MSSFRLRATPILTSFLGLLDLKLGATLITLFAGLNKVAGAYGMLAVVLSGGAALSQPLGQVSMYVYSIASLAAFIWGLKKCSEENGPKTLLYAHIFALDHLLGTLYTTFFAVVWYAWVPHDGRRVANSDAQKAMMGGAGTHEMDEATRTAAAMTVWEGERGFSAAVLVLGWVIKCYFILVLYSYALHLRHGTYQNLPLSSRNTVPSSKYSSSSHPTASSRHTRHSSTGGPQYTHLRGNSLASTAGIGGGRGSIDGLDGTETTLAETLWEEEEQQQVSSKMAPPPALGERRPSARLPPVVATKKLPNGADAPPESPAFAVGVTGMARGVSAGAGPTLASGGGAVGQEQQEQGQNNPFSSILGRLSQDLGPRA